ncbi:hypothetical protein [Levilactobacillus angrenensis]|uniref:Uncharacterized protein n=1 Tax=Levilactobacillus angrenensis TaxID=2486020 RepID=A0ABW1UBS3_9LACO|nr:hypothetical protein [Levilactobacillus angrenensis]
MPTSHHRSRELRENSDQTKTGPVAKDWQRNLLMAMMAGETCLVLVGSTPGDALAKDQPDDK